MYHRGFGLKKTKDVTIYQYVDYRKFLRDKFLQKKDQERNFSYRKFSLLAGLSSPNFLKLVIENKRNLSEAGIRKFAVGFRLNETEEEYFRNMVLMNQSKSHEEKDCFYRKMVQCKGFARTHLLEKKKYEYYSAWYHPVVRELVVFQKGTVDAKWISEHTNPQITEGQAKRSLKLLEELGMIKREDDRWLQANPIVTTGPEVSSVLVTKYHKNMIAMAKESIERFPSRQRDISSVTIRVNKENMPEVKKAAIEFRKQLLGLESLSNEKDETIMQLNIQIFPLTNVLKGGGK